MNDIKPSTKFLDGLDESPKQWIQWRFLDVIRKGEPRPTEPADVVECIKHILLTTNDPEQALRLRARLEQFPEDALALAAHNPQQQAKTSEQKKKEKAEKGWHFSRENRLQKPATGDQLAALHFDDCDWPVGSFQEAMDLIGQVMPACPPATRMISRDNQ